MVVLHYFAVYTAGTKKEKEKEKKRKKTTTKTITVCMCVFKWRLKYVKLVAITQCAKLARVVLGFSASIEML